MNCDIFIPIRLDSKRLPHKHLKEIDGKPILHYLLERLHNTKKIRNIIVCTTTRKVDDPLIEFLTKEGVKFFRGNTDDILARYLSASNEFNTDIIIDVGGDDVYTDPLYVDKIASVLKNTTTEYVEGVGFPHGLVPAGFKTKSLRLLCEIKKTSNTEHGYRFFFKQNKIFTSKFITPDSNLKIPKNIRLTLDYQEDFNLAKILFKLLGNRFHLEDILQLIQDKPEILKTMSIIENKWKKNFTKKMVNYSLDDKK